MKSEKSKDAIYNEGNQAVLLAAKLAEHHTDAAGNVDVGHRVSDDKNREPDEDWPVLFIDHEHLGQMGWHLPEDALSDWVEEKYLPTTATPPRRNTTGCNDGSMVSTRAGTYLSQSRL